MGKVKKIRHYAPVSPMLMFCDKNISGVVYWTTAKKDVTCKECLKLMKRKGK